MTTDVAHGSLRSAALLAGWALLAMTVAAVVGNDLSIRSLVVVDDAEATLRNLVESETLFRIGVLAWLVILIADLVAAFGLYLFMRPVDDRLALLMAWSRLAYIAMLGAAIDNLVDAALLVGNVTGSVGGSSAQASAGELAGTGPAVLHAIAAFDQTWSLGLVVFGMHVMLLGVLILKSSYVPKPFGFVLLVAAVGYVVTHLSAFMLPSQTGLARILGWIFIGPMLGEVALGFWLLFKGGKSKRADAWAAGVSSWRL